MSHDLAAFNLDSQHWNYCDRLDLGLRFKLAGAWYIVLHEAQARVMARGLHPDEVFYNHPDSCLMLRFEHDWVAVDEDGYQRKPR